MGFAAAAQAQYLIVGNDEKVAFTDGKPVLSPPGKDTVSIIDIRDRAKPRIVVNLPLENSVFGPPTNLAITPDGKLALVTNSIDVVKDGDTLKSVPGNNLFVIDLTTSPPAVIATIQTGKQPSGMAINRAGNLALVANRADNSVSVLSISGKTVAVVGTVALAPADAPSQQPSAVAITPDGKRALVAKATANKVALLDIDGTTVTYKGYDMLTGVFPYNVQITADGRRGLVNHDGNAGVADGQVSTVAVIDMTLDPPREVDQVVVGDGPEGLAVNPTDAYAVTLLTNGSGGSVPNNAFFRHDHAVAVLLKTDGKKVRKLGETEVGTLAEGIAFSPDGRFLYIANLGEQELATYRLAGNKLVPVGLPLKLPGHPASMRGSTP
ncbi:MULTISPECIES: YncE family protein [unclassified Bradyrhizobium]|uniref:YncE family protein n=1 Tax=unclassified Bradyrhizobium TaxID=2631580 RepID=UPI002479E11E|nr:MULTISPECIES: YncE family protein [unclassified Bradyrhizobium]WGS20599.1 YncE family protein [Bradyrhizobium sp. ISRA463]WGS27487.1 YncE family protein [Bradyrhizobium sp. ISRA464]